MEKHGRRNSCFQGKRSPIKTAALFTLASLRRSFHAFQLKLKNIISKFPCFSAPNCHKGYQVLDTAVTRKDEHDLLLHEKRKRCLVSLGLSSKSNRALPPLIYPNKKTIFLDMDETLVHATSDPRTRRFDFVVRPRIHGISMTFYVVKRPGVDELLMSLAEKYEVVVFTAGLKEYASLVLDKLDKRGLICHRLYRDSCKVVEGRFVKDLSEVGRDLKNVVIVDDNPISYLLQPSNAIPIRKFIDDHNDRELYKLAKFFQGCHGFDDMRDAVRTLRHEGRN